ncbi:MAG: phage tail protein [Rhizobiales bacterium]|nr:phage tail protein [Hyphomicrobiales bacterium]
MSEPYIGQVQLFGFNFAPRGWAFCTGQLLAIAQNTALFSLLGTTYGGDGRTTFGLPDLRGRVPIGAGQGPGLANYTWGDRAGREQVTLTISQMPSHTHVSNAITGPADFSSAPRNNRAYVVEPTGVTEYDGKPAVIQNSGGSQPFDIRNPYLAMNYSIALLGIFPSRS